MQNVNTKKMHAREVLIGFGFTSNLFFVKPNKDHCKTKAKETQIICTLKIKVKAAHSVNWSFDLHYL